LWLALAFGIFAFRPVLCGVLNWRCHTTPNSSSREFLVRSVYCLRLRGRNQPPRRAVLRRLDSQLEWKNVGGRTFLVIVEVRLLGLRLWPRCRRTVRHSPAIARSRGLKLRA
jgi:hypothetical protein